MDGDSIDKIITSYFAAITKIPFRYKQKIYNPIPLQLSQSLANGFMCLPNCAGCCKKWTLDYITPQDNLTPRTIKIDNRNITVWSDMQQDNDNYYCRHVNFSNGRCEIHGQHPFSCQFELIRIYNPTIISNNRIGVGLYGRGNNYIRVDGNIGASCTITKPTEQSIIETIEKLKQLQQWANYFGLAETWIPQIIQYLQNNEWLHGPKMLGNLDDITYKRPTKHPGRELLYQLIEKGTYTRAQIQQKLQNSYPNVPSQSWSRILTDIKNPDYSTAPKSVIVENNIWKYATD